MATDPSQTRIVVLDGHTANPGDLSWDELGAFGHLTVFPRTAAADVVARAREADLVLTNKVVLDRATLAQLPKLRYIGVVATGYNVVDCAAAREQGIVVTNVSGYGAKSVAQLTLALLLELTNGVGDHARGVREGKWTRSPDFSYWDRPLIELDGLTLGLVGYGEIGRAVAKCGRGLGMRVRVHTRTPVANADVEFVGLEQLLAESDVVSLHCPLTEKTRGMINAQRLALMKPTAFLINTSRGLLLDEAAVAAALNAGRLAGAGLDVLSVEPPPADNPLLSARNCLVTPHLAWATLASRRRLIRVVIENVRAYLAGEPQNVVV